MLVVAMIPLSAAAAEYTPTGSITPVAGGTFSFTGDPVATSDGWTVEFSYTTDTPQLVIQLGATGEDFRYQKDGQWTDGTPGTAFDLEIKDGQPVPLKFQVYKTGDTSSYSKTYTINWSVAEASSEITVKSAKLGASGEYTGVVDNTAGTIKFTVPFGYSPAGNTDLEIKANDGVDTSGVTSFTGSIATNKQKGEAQIVTLRAQNGETTKDYTITVEEADALTSFKLGDVAGVFEKNDDGTEKGIITVTMPGAKLDAEDNDSLKLVPTFTVGSAYEKVEVQTDGSSGKKPITSGEEFDFKWLLDPSNTGNTATITVTSDAGTTREYTLKLDYKTSTTTISGFTATDSASFDAEGTVNGKKLSAVVSKNATKVAKVTFEVPVGAKVQIASGTDTEDDDKDGKVSITQDLNLDTDYAVVVTSADGEYKGYYTLTLTKAESANTQPSINAAKLTLTVDNKDVEFVGSIPAPPSPSPVFPIAPKRTALRPMT
ncbi:MAG: hypothetical protein ACOYJZ_09015 [Acutalibacter sp.]